MSKIGTICIQSRLYPFTDH